jgi:hypothetical protein
VTRREMLALSVSAAGLRAQSAADRNGAARDLVYQALEQLSAHASPQDVTRAMRFLRGALDQYASFGDAHYYRYLCLKHLNQEPALQKSEMEAALRCESEALRDQRDPFVLAVPRIYDNLTTIGQKWALVVGISRFQPQSKNKDGDVIVGAPPLDYAASDAEHFAEVLKDSNVGRFPPAQVNLLTDKAATTGAIKAGLNTIARKAKPEDVVVVYFATHGSARDKDIRGVSYLYTWDTDVSATDQIFGTALAMVDISGIMNNRCVAQRTVLILDTCHSGAGLSGQAVSTADINRLREGAGRYICSSCGENESAFDGLFTASLIEHMRARQGCIRLSDLFVQVQKDVSEAALTKRNGQQRPVMMKSDSAAEIVLGAAVGGASDGCLAD